MARLHALVVFGTRPELIKLAPVIAECRRRSDELALTVCSTGQHRDLITPLMDYFDIRSDIDLALMRAGQSLTSLSARMLAALDAVLSRVAPDCVVAQGDTATVFAAAVAAFFHRLPLVHVEAGLRSGDLAAPWPEEFSRRTASLAARLHCAPTVRAVENLLAEGVPASNVILTGNTVVDALMQTVERERANADRWRRIHATLGNRRLVLVTMHRRENHGEGLSSICAAIGALAERFSDVKFVCPVHPNPQVRQTMHEMLRSRKNIRLVPPVAYPEFVWLLDRATLVITDSGGVQEEAPSLDKPVLVLRECTERPEAIACGAAKLVGTDRARIVQSAADILDGHTVLTCQKQNPFGDGRAAERIVSALIERISSAERAKGAAGKRSPRPADVAQLWRKQPPVCWRSRPRYGRPLRIISPGCNGGRGRVHDAAASVESGIV